MIIRDALAAAFTVVAVICVAAVSALATSEDDPPDGVEMLLPRGGIPAVFQPQFVTADEADITDDAWVLGVFHNSVAKAYSLNLLNHHEIVNDDFGGDPLAAVW